MTNLIKHIGKFIGYVVIGLTILLLLGSAIPKDNSDGAYHRSGLVVRTDCLTGLQYLETMKWGIQPRFDAEGQQVRDFSNCM